MTLDAQTVHIWPVHLRGSDADLTAFDRILSPEEQTRAARFAFPHLRRAYVFGRGALRHLLASYTGIAPAALSFAYGPQGKPSLVSPTRVRFNASHSGEQALFAFTLDIEIGVDIEAIREIPEVSQIARQFFCRAEEADLLALPPDQRQFAFSRCWTRKEAYIKAKGGGLSIPLDSFRVSLIPGEEVRFVKLAPDDAGTPWTLHDLEIFDGFAGALAYPDTARHVRTFPPANVGELTNRMIG